MLGTTCCKHTKAFTECTCRIEERSTNVCNPGEPTVNLNKSLVSSLCDIKTLVTASLDCNDASITGRRKPAEALFSHFSHSLLLRAPAQRLGFIDTC